MIVSGIIDTIRMMSLQSLRPFSAAAMGLAVGCVAVATGLRYALGFISPDIVPFATFYPSILLVTFLAGAWAGTLTLVLGAIVSWWLFLSPPFVFFPIAPHDAVNLMVYLLVGAIIVLIAAMFRRTRRQWAESLEAA